jgi:hypothetical protein
MKNRFNGFGKITMVVLVLAAAMLFAGCEQEVKEAAAAVKSFRNVESITNLNKRGIVGIPFDLNTAAVKPMQANPDIVWTVAADDAGTVGIKTEDIVDGKFTPAAAGELKLLATIQDGLGSGAPYTQDVSVTFMVGDVDHYMPVTKIEGVRKAAPLGFANLAKDDVYVEPNGDVDPDDGWQATYTAIEWTVKEAGTTGAEIVNKNVLKTSAVGTVKVEAKVAWGRAISADVEEHDWREEFDIEVLEEAPVYEGEDDDDESWDDENGNWDDEINYDNPLVLSKTSLRLVKDGTEQLTAKIGDETVDVWWVSNKPDVVSVDNEGNVRAKGRGDVVIKAKAKKTGQTASCEVSVSVSEAGLYQDDEETPKVTGTTNLLTESFTWIKTNSKPGSTYTIALNENISASSGFKIGTGPSSSSTGNTANKNVNLKIILVGIPSAPENTSNPYANNITITMGANGALFTVYGNNASDVPELVLDENITLVGKSGDNNSNNSSLVVIGNTTSGKTGKLTMKADSQITGNTSSANAGGVNLLTGSVFTMDGGSIDNNKGSYDGNGSGGVRLLGTFTMNGGTIENNTGASAFAGAGGVFVGYNSTFTMNGGTICKNTKTATTGNGGGGVMIVSGGNFTMTGGTISGNTSDVGTKGVAVADNGTFTNNGGSVQTD